MAIPKMYASRLCCLLLVLIFSVKSAQVCAQRYGVNDTIVTGMIIYNGDTMEAKTLLPVDAWGKMTAAQREKREKWTRLRNAVYVTYPYAMRAGALMNDINAKMQNMKDQGKRRDYIKSREKELRKEFTDPLTNLSTYQGRVLMKLINRETGNNCYEIIKEYKGGLTARFYQTVAFFFSSNLKQPYNPTGEDAEIEQIVLEVRRMYGYRS